MVKTSSHEDMAQQLIAMVEQERQHLTALELDEMLELCRERVNLVRHVVDLAAQVPIDPSTAVVYRRAQDMARENFEVLKSAHVTVREFVERVAAVPAPTYGNAGRIQRSRGSGTLVWKG